MKFLFCLFAVFLYTLLLSAQYCATDYFHRLNATPEALEAERLMNERIYKQTINPQSGLRRAVVVIPVVVHIVHDNGIENLPDSQIIAVIDHFNLISQNLPPYTDSTGRDIEIRFCLATVDQEGNPTNGITRTQSPMTELFSMPSYTDAALKNLIRWSPHLYINIWIVRNLHLTTAGGYANFPSSAGTSIDGIVVRYNSYTPEVIAHEFGHLLSLYHTWQLSCDNYNCLLDGDKVCDTPPDVSNDPSFCMVNSCATEMDDTTGNNPFTTDVPELPNIMDYTSCPKSFSEGQKTRMLIALNQYRSTLLQSNGCGQNPGGAVPVASFQFVDTCPHPIFIDTDPNSLGSFWDFNGDGLTDDYGKVVKSPYTTSGMYNITAVSCGYGGLDTVTQQLFVYGKPHQSYPMIAGVSGLSVSQFHPGEFVYCQGSMVNINAEPGFVSYQWSTGDTTQNITITPSGPFSVSLTAIDSTGHAWVSCFPVTATPVPPAIPPVISFLPPDSAYCYDDYGDSLTVHATLSPLTMTVQWMQDGQPVNTPDSANFHTVIQSHSSWYMVSQTDSNGCYASEMKTLNLNYNMPGFSMIQNGDTLSVQLGLPGIIWYRDGIPIPGADSSYVVMDQPGCYTLFAWYGSVQACGSWASDTICKTVTAVGELVNEGFSVYPNPAEDFILVKSDKDTDAEYSLLSIDGRIVREGFVKRKESRIYLSELPAGIYLLRIDGHSMKIMKE